MNTNNNNLVLSIFGINYSLDFLFHNVKTLKKTQTISYEKVSPKEHTISLVCKILMIINMAVVHVLYFSFEYPKFAFCNKKKRS